MKVLIVDDDNSIIELLAIILENSIAPTFIGRAASTDSAIRELKENDYNLVICDYEMYPSGTGQDVFNYIIEAKKKLLFLLFSSRDFDTLAFKNIEILGEKNFSYLKKPASAKIIRETVSKFVKSSNDIHDFYGVRIHNFIRFEKTKCDIYLKLSTSKFVKILNADDNYEASFLQKYLSKEVSHFYITKADYNDFLVEFGNSNFLISTSNTKSFLDTALKSHLYLTSLVANVGISQFVLDEANELAIKSLNMSQTDSVLSKLLERLIKSQNYSYDHTFLITCFCTQIGLEIGLNKVALEKLAYAALIHDIGIARNDLCILHDLFPERIEKLELQEQYILKNHHLILEKFSNINDLTDDLKNILKFHHIYDNLYPYNDKINLDRINQIVGVFLVSHLLSNEMFKNDFEVNKLGDSLTLVKHTFSGQNFEKILRALDIIIFRKKII